MWVEHEPDACSDHRRHGQLDGEEEMVRGGRVAVDGARRPLAYVRDVTATRARKAGAEGEKGDESGEVPHGEELTRRAGARVEGG